MKILPKGTAVNVNAGGGGCGGASTVFITLPGVYLSEKEWKQICALAENEWGWSQEEFLAFLHRDNDIVD